MQSLRYGFVWPIHNKFRCAVTAVPAKKAFRELPYAEPVGEGLNHDCWFFDVPKSRLKTVLRILRGDTVATKK